MKREIKFRAWHGDGPMKYKVGIHPFMLFRLSSSDLCEEGEYNDNTGDLVVNPSDYNVMQFTGLKDKNGKEIYEGDILKRSTEERGKIVFNEIFSMFDFCSLDREFNSPLYNVRSDSEIIGNIHENPELLK